MALRGGCLLQDKMYLGYMALVHAGALLAPFYFSWGNLAMFMGMVRGREDWGGDERVCSPAQPVRRICQRSSHLLFARTPRTPRSASRPHALPPGLLPRPQYFITGCLGITLSYHRQLSHRSFTTPKWLEYVFAYCGVMAVQGDPLEWVSVDPPARACLTPRYRAF